MKELTALGIQADLNMLVKAWIDTKAYQRRLLTAINFSDLEKLKVVWYEVTAEIHELLQPSNRKT